MTTLSGAGGGGSSSNSSSPSLASTLLADDVVEVNLGLAEGPLAGLLKGPRTFYLGDTPLVGDDGTHNFNPFELHLYYGDNNPSEIRNSLGGITSSQSVGVTTAQNVAVVRQSPSQLRGKIDRLEVRLVVQQLTTNAGGESTVAFEVNYKRSDQSVWLPLIDDEPNLSIKGKTSSSFPKEFSRRVPRTSSHDWDIQVIKRTADNSTTSVAVLQFESVQYVEMTDKSYPNTAVVRFIGRAAEQFSSIPTTYGIYQAKIVRVPINYDPVTRYYNGDWDGSEWKWAFTDNLAWCLYDICTNETYGAKKYYPNLLVDRFTIYEAAKWCDELVPRTGSTFQPRFTYSDMIAEPRNALEQLDYMAGIMSAFFVRQQNRYLKLVVDRPGPVVQIFTPETVDVEGFSYQFTEVSSRINTSKVTFLNPDLGFTSDYRRVSIQQWVNRNGPIEEEFTAVGCLDPYEAQRRAMIRILQANTETMTVSFRAPRSASQIEIFQLIGIADPDQNWGLTGRVKSVSGNTITLRDRLLLPTGSDITMTIQTNSGPRNITVQTATSNTDILTIQSGFSWPNNAPDRAPFALTRTSLGFVKPFRVLGIEPDGEFYTITALEHNVNKYDDVNNGEFTGTVHYAAKRSRVPATPELSGVFSGNAQVQVLADGTLNNRVLVEITPKARLNTTTFDVRAINTTTGEVRRAQTSGRSVYMDDFTPGEEWSFSARAIDPKGAKSKFGTAVEHTVLAKQNAPAAPTNLTIASGFETLTVKWDKIADLDNAGYEVFESSTSTRPSTPAATVSYPHYTSAGLTGVSTRWFWVRAVNSSGVRSAFVGPVNSSTTQVGASRINPRGLEIQDTAGNLVISGTGEISQAVYMNIDGSQVQLSALAAGSLVPTLNFVGTFSSAPTQSSLGSNWIQNSIYKLSTTKQLFILTGSPLAWVEYLADGLNFSLLIESSNGTSFRVGQAQSTLLSGRLFKNGAEVTDQTPDSWFGWRRSSGQTTSDTTWSNSHSTGYKQVSIDIDEVSSRATFFCDVIST